jgi:hypothetical protein
VKTRRSSTRKFGTLPRSLVAWALIASLGLSLAAGCGDPESGTVKVAPEARTKLTGGDMNDTTPYKQRGRVIKPQPEGPVKSRLGMGKGAD